MVMLVVTFVGRPARECRTPGAVRIGSGGRSEVIGRHPKLTALVVVVMIMFGR